MAETYQLKYRKFKKQYQLYDDFLLCPETILTFEERSKLIYEMGRILAVINKINEMTYYETKKINDDYNIVLSSSMNYK